MSILPIKCRNYLRDHGVAYEESADERSIVLRGYQMPAGRFDADKADILIVLPAGYPDVRPDMFYAQPWLRLVKGGNFPKAADQPHEFKGQKWQRWSRHSDQWRPGIDGIWTMLRRIDAALEAAA